VDENFLFFEFDEKEQYKPYYAVYSENNELLFKNGIKHAEMYNKFSGIHYHTCTLKSHLSNGESILYSPESVFKIQPITLKERVLFLYSKKRFGECIDLVNSKEKSLTPDLIVKVRNAYLEVMLKEKKFHEVSNLLPQY
jgi:hypothetical protein